MIKDTDTGRDYYFYPESEEETLALLEQVCQRPSLGRLSYESETDRLRLLGHWNFLYSLQFVNHTKSSWGIFQESPMAFFIYPEEEAAKATGDPILSLPFNIKEQMWIHGEGPNKTSLTRIDVMAKDNSWHLQWDLEEPVELEFDMKDGSRHDTYQYQ